MARPKSANPEATRDRVEAAARSVIARDGIAGLSARSVASAAGVSATTVSALFGGMHGLTARLIARAFEPLAEAFEAVDDGDWRQPAFVAISPLRHDPTLAPFVTQIAGYAGLRGGIQRSLAHHFEAQWQAIHKHLVEFELPNSPLRSEPDRDEIANEIITDYFVAAFHLARDPKRLPKRLQMLID